MPITNRVAFRSPPAIWLVARLCAMTVQKQLERVPEAKRHDRCQVIRIIGTSLICGVARHCLRFCRSVAGQTCTYKRDRCPCNCR
jgi:hypothetical protein